MNADVVARAGSESESVYVALRQAIIRNAIGPGETLVEGVLAQRFGVSRSPVREALGRLTHEGLLARNGRALAVRVLRPEDVLELYEVRIPLSRTAARAAAERHSALDLARLRESVAAMHELRDSATEHRSQLAYDFHEVIWRAGHNPVLAATLEQLQVRVQGLASTTLHLPGRWAQLIGECDGIAAAIADRDADRAGDLAEQQMIRARDYRVRIYSNDPELRSVVLPTRA